MWDEEKHYRSLWLGLRVSVSLCHWRLLKGFSRVLYFPLDESQVDVQCHLSLLYLEEGSVVSDSPSWGVILAMLKYVTHRFWWTASFPAGFILKKRLHIHHNSLWKFSLSAFTTKTTLSNIQSTLWKNIRIPGVKTDISVWTTICWATLKLLTLKLACNRGQAFTVMLPITVTCFFFFFYFFFAFCHRWLWFSLPLVYLSKFHGP